MSLQDYPNWLGPMLFTGKLPWDDMTKSSLHEFLSFYTMHDSYFITLHISPGHYAVAVIRWDTAYDLRDFDWPLKNEKYAFLLIYLPSFYQVRMEQDAIILPFEVGEVKSRTLTDEQRMALLNAELLDPFHEDSTFEFLLEPPLCKSTFLSVENARLDIIHGEEVYFVCLDDDKRVYPIPKIKPI